MKTAATNLKVKVCGMREPCNISAVAALHPDYMGFIFCARSPRFCDGISPDMPAYVAERGVVPVMVTVDMPVDELSRLAGAYGFRTIQLHGSESPEICSALKSGGFTVWKAMSLKSPEDMERLAPYVGVVDMFLFDTPTANHGGSGRKFDWELLRGYTFDRKFMLSGGISPSDVSLIRQLHLPGIEGIDLNSRFETAPALKDVELLRKFMKSIRNDRQ